MDFFDSLLWPIKVAVAWIMVRAHDVLTWLGMDPAGGWTWLLSIVALVVVIRILLIPLFVRQIKASRGMQLVQPEIQKLQKKYKGKTDPASRQAMQQEMMAIYKEAGTSPFASCLPILAQMPIFFALFRVLSSLEAVATGTYARGDSIGPLTQELAAQAESSEIFGASLSSTFLGSDDLAVKFVTAALIIIMSATTLFTQRQLTMKNMPQSALDNPMARQQRMLMYILPLVFAFSGVNFPIGVLVYWSTSNLWSMGQQWFVIRNSPAPGSEAEAKYKERQARKAKRRGRTLEDDGAHTPDTTDTDTLTTGASGQRQQPKRNSPRSKRAGGRPAAVSAGGAVEQESEPEAIAEPAPAPSSKSTKPKK
ncbi:membrane protein insertase YidC [Occultella gossypii]|uniref:Membrane protein insertase YidC n=1 Tax=Occultella gossypii TaxID=2800820 RepID=A0ABS7SB97_9MICO|nr:membrane protein insertase YidC [Occultella gossypii]MBZ2197005.1 membrane protein insertase YidC [Occultella gossypii]